MPLRWVTEFERLRHENPENEWLLAVLADWEITRAEAEESLERTMDCMEAGGWKRPVMVFGGDQIFLSWGGAPEPVHGDPQWQVLMDRWEADEAECRREYGQPASLFFLMTHIPDGAAWQQPWLDCMHEIGVPEVAGVTDPTFIDRWITDPAFMTQTHELAKCWLDPWAWPEGPDYDWAAHLCSGEFVFGETDPATGESREWILPPPAWCP